MKVENIGSAPQLFWAYMLPYNFSVYKLLSFNYSITENWTKVIIKSVTPLEWGDGTVAPIKIRFDNKNSIDGGNVALHVRNIKLEYGNIPTDWTPAPEDAVPAITNQRDGSALNMWSGTAAQLPAERRDDTIYFVV
jgi:hypothetical protein